MWIVYDLKERKVLKTFKESSVDHVTGPDNHPLDPGLFRLRKNYGSTQALEEGYLFLQPGQCLLRFADSMSAHDLANFLGDNF